MGNSIEVIYGSQGPAGACKPRGQTWGGTWKVACRQDVECRKNLPSWYDDEEEEAEPEAATPDAR
jgi:hypothetical protein